MKVERAGECKLASDHFPVIADFQLDSKAISVTNLHEMQDR